MAARGVGRHRFPSEYALANKVRHPRNVYLRQDAFEAEVSGWLSTVFAPTRLPETIDRMMAGQHDATDTAAAEAARAQIEDANLKMARYRAALDADGDPRRSANGSPSPKPSGSKLMQNYAKPPARPH